MASDFVFPYKAAATGGAGPYVESSWRIVLHTTETNSRPSAWIPNFQYPSHIVCSYEHQEIWQLIGFNTAGKALYHAPGGVQTNLMGAIQIEINGYADDAGNWSQDKLKWLGEKVLKPICDWIDVNGGFDCYNIPAPGAHGGSASADAPQRMTDQEWINFNGICGHRHVPDNDHYDPDQLNVRQIVDYANNNTTGDFLMALSEAEQRELLDKVRMNYAVWFDGGGRWGQLWTAAAQTAAIAPQVNRISAVTERFNTDIYAKSTGSDPQNPGNSINLFDDLKKFLTSAPTVSDIAKAVVSALPAQSGGTTTTVDYAMVEAIVTKVVATALENLSLHT